MNDIERAALKAATGLDYQIDFALEAAERVGVAGKRVLEVGGSLPPQVAFDVLGAAQWVAVEEMGYWDEIAADREDLRRRILPIATATDPGRLGDYTVLGGRIEDLSPGLYGHFDLVISFAAFEHILELGYALWVMRWALKPQGRLFSKFSPIWPAHDGHHLPDVTDMTGQCFNFGRNPMPPWGHLLYSPAEAFAHLWIVSRDVV